MSINRRDFVKGLVAGTAGVAALGPDAALARERVEALPDAVGMLYDATLCIGCKACQVACKEANGLQPEPGVYLEGLYDAPVDLSGDTKTLIKICRNGEDWSYYTAQCMHCVDPGCVSVCMMAALHKAEHGIVAYDPGLCIGCRNCQVACPFNVPRFQWSKTLPMIVKCELCRHLLAEGRAPGCCRVCPREAIVYGQRNQLLQTAKKRIAAMLEEALQRGVANLKILPGNKTMPAPMTALVTDPEIQVDGYLLPGHVSVISGSEAFRKLARDWDTPCVVTGFTPVDILRAAGEIVRMRREGRAEVVNHYTRVVRPEGNHLARRLVDRWFEPCDAEWRGLGVIPASGLGLREEHAARDASLIPVDYKPVADPAGCRCGDVLKGILRPDECPLFGPECRPEQPVGACMVSAEGACAAYYRHERLKVLAGS